MMALLYTSWDLVGSNVVGSRSMATVSWPPLTGFPEAAVAAGWVGAAAAAGAVVGFGAAAAAGCVGAAAAGAVVGDGAADGPQAATNTMAAIASGKTSVR